MTFMTHDNVCEDKAEREKIVFSSQKEKIKRSCVIKIFLFAFDISTIVHIFNNFVLEGDKQICGKCLSLITVVSNINFARNMQSRT
jgi:hypothetical protein